MEGNQKKQTAPWVRWDNIAIPKDLGGWGLNNMLHSKNPPSFGKKNRLAEDYFLCAKLGQRDQSMVDQRYQCDWRLAYPR